MENECVEVFLENEELVIEYSSGLKFKLDKNVTDKVLKTCFSLFERLG